VRVMASRASGKPPDEDTRDGESSGDEGITRSDVHAAHSSE
jgi:hypothetical protein